MAAIDVEISEKMNELVFKKYHCGKMDETNS